MSEKFTHINKVSDAVPDEKLEEVVEFTDKYYSEKFVGKEIKPSPEERNVIECVCSAIKKYLNEVLSVTPKEISIDDIRLLASGTLIETGGGLCAPGNGKVFVEELAGFSGSKLAFAKTLAHELLHLFSYISMIHDPDDQDWLEIGKSGLAFGEKGYFDMIDEALTSSLAHDICDNYLESAEFIKEKSDIKKIFSWFKSIGDAPEFNKLKSLCSIPYADEIATYLDSIASDEDKISFVRMKLNDIDGNKFDKFKFERVPERDIVETYLKNIADLEGFEGEKLTERSRELFVKLCRSKFTGIGYLEIARIINKTFGRGTFREMAEELAKD